MSCCKAMNWPFPAEIRTALCKGKPPTIRLSDCRPHGSGRIRRTSRRSKGYTVVDAVSIIGTHLTEVVRRHAHELFTRQDTKTFCDRVAQDNPKVVEDLVPKLLQLATVQRVIQNMLRERVPIRDAVGILEALGEAAQSSKNPVLLTEYVRQSIRRGIVRPLMNAQGELPAYLLDPSIERAIESTIEHARTEQRPDHGSGRHPRYSRPDRKEDRQG